MSSLPLPGTGTMQSGRLYRRPTLVPPTNVNGSSSWPTAVTTDGRSSARHSTSGSSHPGTSLTDALRTWPTPNTGEGWRGNDSMASREGSPSLTGIASDWPTPLASDGDQRGRNKTIVEGRIKAGRVLKEAATEWPTPLVPNGGRTTNVSNEPRPSGAKGSKILEAVVGQWPTPAARDYRTPNSAESQERRAEGRETAGQQLQNFVEHNLRATWPTPAATPYGSSQNGINGKGGEFERPSAGTPSLERMSRSFPLDPMTSDDGRLFSLSDQTSPPPSTWKTPHGFANTDASGHTAGGGGEFHKQAMQGASPKMRLNPRFVEYLMGLPVGWTAFAPAATELSRWRQRMRSTFWRLARG